MKDPLEPIGRSSTDNPDSCQESSRSRFPPARYGKPPRDRFGDSEKSGTSSHSTPSRISWLIKPRQSGPLATASAAAWLLSGTNRNVERRAKLASGACSLPVSNFVTQPANDRANMIAAQSAHKRSEILIAHTKIKMHRHHLPVSPSLKPRSPHRCQARAMRTSPASPLFFGNPHLKIRVKRPD